MYRKTLYINLSIYILYINLVCCNFVNVLVLIFFFFGEEFKERFPWRREWHHTSIFLPGEFHGQRSLVGYGPWGRKESNITE